MSENRPASDPAEAHVDVHEMRTKVGDIPEAVLDALRQADAAARETADTTDDTTYLLAPAAPEVVFQATRTPLPIVEPAAAPSPVEGEPPAPAAPRPLARQRARALVSVVILCLTAYLGVVATCLLAQLLLGW